MEDELHSKVAKVAHKAINHVCDLYWSVLDEVPEHRRDPRTSRIVPSSVSYPKTVHAGYGEMTYSALDSLLVWLCCAAPSSLRLSSDSCFLDLGSGFAKCVIHARLRGQVRRSVGIEFVPMRHSKASDVLRYLDEGEVPGFCDKQQLLTHLSQHRMLSGVELIQGNIVDEQQARHIYSASHVFAFDVLFGDVLMQRIVNHIQRSSHCRLYLSYHCPARMLRLDFDWRCIHQMRTRTTGKQQFTCYVYANPACQSQVDQGVEALEASADSPRGDSTGDGVSEESTPIPSVNPPEEACPSSRDDALHGEDVLPDDDHRQCFCLFCGKHCSPNGQGSKKRQRITADWKNQAEASGRVRWSKPEKVAIHVGCRTKVWKMMQ
jgi:hypothetical protein